MSDNREEDFCIKPLYVSRVSPEYYEDNEEDVTYQPDVYPLAASLGQQFGCTHVIDVGCGRAKKLVKLYPHFQIIGIDFGENLRACSKLYDFGAWIEWNLDGPGVISLQEHILKRSIIICADVIEHLVNPAYLLNNLRAWLDHAPICILSTPERDLARGEADLGPPENIAHVREWNIKEFEMLLRSKGFNIISIGLTRSDDQDNEKNTILAIIKNNKYKNSLQDVLISRPATSLSDISTKEFTITPHKYEIEVSEQLEQLLKDLKIQDGARILELSAGTSSISAHLASKGYKTTVTDFSEDRVKKAKAHYEKSGLKGNFHVFDMFKISKEAVGTHDAVFITEILDHYDGWEVIQALEKMKELGQYVIVLSQNPKCMPYLLYNRAAKERGDWRSGLSIFRESFEDFAMLAGLEVIKETFFSATSLSKWMAKQVSPETGQSYADSVDQNLIPEDQRHFKVLVAKPQTREMEPNERIALYKRVYESEIKALHKSYNFDIQAFDKRISDLEEELVTRINSIRQLELVQEYGNMMIKTPMGLLLSLYYQRADLQQAFPEVVNHDYRRLLKWAQETVDGETRDYSINKLREFADWYGQIGGNLHPNDIENVIKTPMGLLLSLYYQRADLQQAFPEVVNHDYRRLLKWAQDTVNGITGDSNTDQLLRFADWYKQTDDNLRVTSDVVLPQDNESTVTKTPTGLSYRIPEQYLLNEILGSGTTPEAYLQGGFIVSSGLRNSLHALGKDIHQFKRVLEFGCGSARVLRWFSDLQETTEFVGIDISAKAIDWCKQNIPFGKFTVCNPLPPLPFPDGSFDLIYAVSVLTHLDEDYQLAWLKELQRISQPGGIIMLTIHGDNKAEMALPDKELAEFQNKGFLYKKPSIHGGVDGGPDFYQVAYHSRKYIEKVWSKFFRVIGYFRHGTMWHQDLVILENSKQIPGEKLNEDEHNYMYLDLPIAFLESPKPSEIIKENMTLSGWAFHPHGGKLELDIWIDKRKYTTCSTELLREDIGLVYQKYQNAKFSGFVSAISIANLKPGFHTILLSRRGSLEPIMTSYFFKE